MLKRYGFNLFTIFLIITFFLSCKAKSFENDLYYIKKENDKYVIYLLHQVNTEPEHLYESDHISSFHLSPQKDKLLIESLFFDENYDINQEPEIGVYDLNTRYYKKLILGRNPQWMPDGDSFLFTKDKVENIVYSNYLDQWNNRKDNIYKYYLDTNNNQFLHETQGQILNLKPLKTPEGIRIYYNFTNNNGLSDLFVIDENGKVLDIFLYEQYKIQDFYPSPNGDKICFSSNSLNKSGNSLLIIIDYNGLNKQILINTNKEIILEFQWSNDGKKIAYIVESKNGFKHKISLINTENYKNKRLLVFNSIAPILFARYPEQIYWLNNNDLSYHKVSSAWFFELMKKELCIYEIKRNSTFSLDTISRWNDDY
ncbi:MAG: hypothetical protein PQJ44_07585 [Sphaerochaetaceae bacterium]|nr:hypothetical protein [Sphaerochaetaceae bacterium]